MASRRYKLSMGQTYFGTGPHARFKFVVDYLDQVSRLDLEVFFKVSSLRPHAIRLGWLEHCNLSLKARCTPSVSCSKAVAALHYGTIFVMRCQQRQSGSPCPPFLHTHHDVPPPPWTHTTPPPFPPFPTLLPRHKLVLHVKYMVALRKLQGFKISGCTVMSYSPIAMVQVPGTLYRTTLSGCYGVTITSKPGQSTTCEEIAADVVFFFGSTASTICAQS